MLYFRTKNEFTGFHEVVLKYKIRILSLYTYLVSEVTGSVQNKYFFSVLHYSLKILTMHVTVSPQNSKSHILVFISTLLSVGKENLLLTGEKQ